MLLLINKYFSHVSQRPDTQNLFDNQIYDEKKVQLARKKFNWREKSSVGEKKVQLVR